MKKRFFETILFLFVASSLLSMAGEGRRFYKNQNFQTIELGIAFGDSFRNERFMTFIRDMGADVTLIKLRWKQIEPYPPNHPDYVFDTTVLDNFLSQLEEGDFVLINVFTASDWATDQTCEQTTQRKGCPLKDEATCLAEYGITCAEAYKNFIRRLVRYTDEYLASRGLNLRIKYWQRDTEPAISMHFPSDRPGDYVELQRYFYESVKAVNPSALVVGVCAASYSGREKGYSPPPNSDFFRYVIAHARNYFDLMDVRFYHSVYTIPQRIGWFLQEMKKNDYEKPIITTEGGGPTPFEFSRVFSGVLNWCSKNAYGTRIYECLYKMDGMGRLPEEMAIFLPYDPRDQKSVERERKMERMLCRDIVQRTLILLENGVRKQWRWEIRAPKRNFCAGPHKDIDVYGDIVFNKLAFIRYPGIICNEYSPTSPRRREIPYQCYKRMKEKLRGAEKITRIRTEDSNIFLYRIYRSDGSILYVVWEKRDIFHGEEQPATGFEFRPGFTAARITDVFGEGEVKFAEDGILSLEVTDTPLYIEATKAIRKRR